MIGDEHKDERPRNRRTWRSPLTNTQARKRLRLLYGMTDIRRDPNGTWWIGSKLRPDLLNLDSLEDAVIYFDTIPDQMLSDLFLPRRKDSA